MPIQTGMTPKKIKREKTVTYGRSGVNYSFPQGEDGPINVAVDFSLVAPPTSYYYADSIAVRPNDELLMVNLSFGRRKRDSNEFADQVDIVMPAQALAGFLASSREVEKTLDQALAQLNLAPRQKPIAPSDFVATTLFANLIFISMNPVETSLDFYHLSTRDVHLAKTKKMDMQLSPVVRVIMASVLGKCFFDLVRPFGSEALQETEGRERATASR